MTTIIVSDFIRHTKVVTLLDDLDFKFIESIWNNQDSILIQMADHVVFENRTRWCDLDTLHFRLMIMRNLIMAAKLSDEERIDTSNPTVKSLHFLIGSLVYCIQIKSGCIIDLMKIIRVTDTDITFNYDSTLVNSIGEGKPKEPEFHIVVDNE